MVSVSKSNDSYVVPYKFAQSEFTEKRSRFISRVWNVDDEESAISNIKATKKEFFDAKHNVYAYIIRNGAVRFSDDGEPQGTAGQPILEVLKREGLSNVCCVVTRYFGGILLGTGGLARAYTKGVCDALAICGRSIVRQHIKLRLTTSYGYLQPINRILSANGCIIGDTAYTENVIIVFFANSEKEAGVCSEITNITNGSAEIERLGEAYIKEPPSV